MVRQASNALTKRPFSFNPTLKSYINNISNTPTITITINTTTTNTFITTSNSSIPNSLPNLSTTTYPLLPPHARRRSLLPAQLPTNKTTTPCLLLTQPLKPLLPPPPP